MNIDKVAPIANAVLYEGHTLYPYRPSAKKNRVRWTFGGVHPRAYSEANGGFDACEMQTQCLLHAGSDARVEVMVRFLHLVNRTVGELAEPVIAGVEPAFTSVESLVVGDQTHYSWEESVERTISLTRTVAELLAGGCQTQVEFPSSRELEMLDGPLGAVGVLVREQESLVGSVTCEAVTAVDDVVRLTVRVRNDTPVPNPTGTSREEAMRRSFISTHTVLEVSAGEFVSLTDPPDELREVARACVNQGTWPVLVGTEGDTDMLLSSPIILEDYPRIAPQSPGNLFDGAEIDEILTLRILTMTEEEKAEARAADPEVRALLDRTESLSLEQMMNLHGVVRGRQAWGGGEP